MRPPVAKNWSDFGEEWYLAQKHGDQTPYGFHDGWDVNLKTGGDSDLGQPVYACLDYTTKWYHYNSHPEYGFGIHKLLEVQVNGQNYWLHYAHLQPDPPHKDSGSEGDIIGYIGKSGRPRMQLPAHLHFAVFRKLPPKFDIIAGNRQQLEGYWIDPDELFKLVSSSPEAMPKYTEEQVTKIRLERDKNWDLYQGALADLEEQTMPREEELKRDTYYTAMQRFFKKLLGKEVPVEDIFDGENKQKAIDRVDEVVDSVFEEMGELEAESESLSGKADEFDKVVEKLEIEKTNGEVTADTVYRSFTSRLSAKETQIKELNEKLEKATESKPILQGKRKLAAAIVSALMVIAAKLSEQYLGIQITPQELLVLAASPNVYTVVEGARDFLETAQRRPR